MPKFTEENDKKASRLNFDRLRKKQILAAMKYLADLQPRRYKLTFTGNEFSLIEHGIDVKPDGTCIPATQILQIVDLGVDQK